MANWWAIQDFGVVFGSSSSSSSQSMVVGSVVWGTTIEGTEEDHIQDFLGNWTIISNGTIYNEIGEETLGLGQTGISLSEIWRSGPGIFHLFTNKYNLGAGAENLLYIEYRTSDTYNGIKLTDWVYLATPNIQSLGYIQLRVSVLSSSSSSSSCLSSSSSSSSSSSCLSSSFSSV
jgi:hypothetical protein